MGFLAALAPALGSVAGGTALAAGGGTALAGGTGLLMGGLGIADAISSNNQINKNAKGLNKANAVNKLQIDYASQDQRDRIARNLARYNGAVNATAAQRNVGQGGSTWALLTSALASARADQTNVNLNGASSKWASDTQTSNQINQLNAQLKNPFMSGIMGGLSGFMTGTNFATSYSMAHPA